MKKVLAILLAFVMVFGLAACGGGGGDEETVETIKIGFAFPMSGAAAMAGKYSTHGADVMKEALGGVIEIKGVEYPIEFIYADTEGTEEKTVNVYQKLIEEA